MADAAKDLAADVARLSKKTGMTALDIDINTEALGRILDCVLGLR